MIDGLNAFLTLDNFLFLNIGVFLGIIFGAIPGLGVMLAIAILLPFTFSVDPISGITMLLGIYCGGTYGGSISAILLNVPGTPAAAATTLDGYPLARSGQAKKPLIMSVVASTSAGLVSAVILLVAAPQLAKLTLYFGPAEYFTLALFALSIIASVSGKDIIKGLIAGCLGIFLATIGLDPATAVTRFTFNNTYLIGGLTLVPALIGLFAFSEVLLKINGTDKVQKTNINLTKGDGLTFGEIRKSLKTIFKSSIIGTIIGVIPGTGGTSAAFISHNEAKRSSKNPENYGKGELDGVAAAEAGNNGVTGATLIPLLTLGIPGDGATAVLLGAFMMNGLIPGPNLFTEHSTTIYAIIIGLIFVNIFMLLQGRLLINFFAKIAKLKDSFLLPILILTCTAGIFAEAGHTFNIYVAIAFGIIAYLLLKFEFPLVPLLLGIILGPIAEENLIRTLTISDGSLAIFFTRPISVFFILLTLLPLVLGFIKMVRKKEAS